MKRYFNSLRYNDVIRWFICVVWYDENSRL